MKTKKRKALRITLITVLAFLILVIGGFYIYTLDYYRADLTAEESAAVAAFAPSDSEPVRPDLTVFRPSAENDRKSGLIFYPGGKVAADAYAPLMARLAESGITCVLVKMPFNLAVFNVTAADGIDSLLPDIRHWYIGGHSLGGAMASSYAGGKTDRLAGLILLAAYPVNDAGIPTLTIAGSEDGVLDKSKLQGVEFLEIAGGNHAYFGNYGEQAGDGTAAITREEQQRQTAAAIIGFIETNNAR
jgi:hypothetical protein